MNCKSTVEFAFRLKPFKLKLDVFEVWFSCSECGVSVVITCSIH